MTKSTEKSTFEINRAKFQRQQMRGICEICGHSMIDKTKPCKECERVRKSRRFIRGHNFHGGKNFDRRGI